MSKHTPGPWFWPHTNALAAGAGGDPEGSWTLVAAIHDAGPVSDADKCLMAAAPDLLEVVRALVSPDANRHNEELRIALLRAMPELAAAARTAIAKAEGK